MTAAAFAYALERLFQAVGIVDEPFQVALLVQARTGKSMIVGAIRISLNVGDAAIDFGYQHAAADMAEKATGSQDLYLVFSHFDPPLVFSSLVGPQFSRYLHTRKRLGMPPCPKEGS